MFFVLSKIFDFMLHPLSWVFFLLILALFQKNARKLKGILLLSLFIAYFFSNAFIFDEFNREWEVSAISMDELDDNYDLCIILGGLMSYNESTGMMDFDGSADRLLAALPMYEDCLIDKILISGGSGSLVEKNPEAELLKNYLMDIGYPESDLLKESKSRNTFENALNTSVMLKEKYPSGKFLLITSASHMRRAKACFKKVGLEVDIYPVDHISGERKYYFDHLFIPQTHILMGWQRLFHEWAGFIAYKISNKC